MVQVLGTGALHHQGITSSSSTTSVLSLACRAPVFPPTSPLSKSFSSGSMSQLLLESALISPSSGLDVAHSPSAPHLCVSAPKCDPLSSYPPVPVFHSPLANSSVSVLWCCLFKAYLYPCLSHPVPITSSSMTSEKALTFLTLESDRFQVNEGSSSHVGLLMLQGVVRN